MRLDTFSLCSSVTTSITAFWHFYIHSNILILSYSEVYKVLEKKIKVKNTLVENFCWIKDEMLSTKKNPFRGQTQLKLNLSNF